MTIFIEAESAGLRNNKLLAIAAGRPKGKPEHAFSIVGVSRVRELGQRLNFH